MGLDRAKVADAGGRGLDRRPGAEEGADERVATGTGLDRVKTGAGGRALDLTAAGDA
jgi:hypothetical protein